ncbi:MAG: hypothetical protein Kow0037_27590 [Calditrichia bacterium]
MYKYLIWGIFFESGIKLDPIAWFGRGTIYAFTGVNIKNGGKACSQKNGLF